MPSPSASAFTVEFLGTGTSTGIPLIGCGCAVCRSPDPRDKRLRPSIVVSAPGGTLLVDTTPDMRTQMLRAGIETVDAVLLTHPHADHLMGLDDLRQFNFRSGRPIPLYAAPETLTQVRRAFDYCFKETPAGGGKPQLTLHALRPGERLQLCGLSILPVTVLHGTLPILSFIVEGRFGYVTDVSRIPPETRPHLHGLAALVLGVVRHEPHPTHFSLGEALDEIRQFAPARAYLTHLSHHLGHASTGASLPPAVALAHDGLRLRFPALGAAPAP